MRDRVYLYQHITKPTRTRQGQEPSILNLVLSNEEGMIQDIEYLSPFGKSDHLVISRMRDLIKRKHRAWQRYSECNYMDENKLMMCRRLRNKVRKVTRYRQKCQEKEIANEAKTNLKKF